MTGKDSRQSIKNPMALLRQVSLYKRTSYRVYLKKRCLRLTGAPDWARRVKSGASSPACTLLFAGCASSSYLLIGFPPCSFGLIKYTFYTLQNAVGTGIKRVVASGCGTLLLSVPVSITTSSPLKERAKRSRLLGAGPSRNSPSTL
jgi:hypothetical protein